MAADLVQEKRRQVVIGDPGAGKTTMMRHLAVQLAVGNIPGMESLVPVYVSPAGEPGSTGPATCPRILAFMKR